MGYEDGYLQTTMRIAHSPRSVRLLTRFQELNRGTFLGAFWSRAWRRRTFDGRSGLWATFRRCGFHDAWDLGPLPRKASPHCLKFQDVVAWNLVNRLPTM